MKTLIFYKKNFKKMRLSSIFIGFTLLSFTIIACLIMDSAVVLAANNKKLSEKKLSRKIRVQKEPDIFHVTSDTMISERDTGVIEFSGNARATNRESTIKADSIKIFLYKQAGKKKKATGEKQQNIKKIIASGKVEYTSGNKKAFSDKAVYTTASEIIVLTGKAPTVTMGDSFVTGKKITLYQKNSRVVVESGKQRRVEALFNSKDRIKETKK